MSSSIVGFGDPLAFLVKAGEPAAVLGQSPSQSVMTVEARQMEGHQKEAVVTEGDGGPAWRVCSDEGLHLKGHDYAPFPLGFFNAGIHGDLFLRLLQQASKSSVSLNACRIHVRNGYWLTGSFALGTGEGHGEPSEISIEIDSKSPAHLIKALVDRAVASSPAIALLRQPLNNTFALYINGRRENVPDIPASVAPDATDPYVRYQSAPRPLATVDVRGDLIEKTALKEQGTPVAAPAGTTTRIVRTVTGDGVLTGSMAEIDTVLQLPGTSHFLFRTDRQGTPSGLSLLAAGIAFCYMTQLSRYIEHMKMAIRGVRLVQFTPFALKPGPNGQVLGDALPIDTHLFLNGEAPDETHAKLLTIAARTCYLHATAATALPPIVSVKHNGQAI